MSRPFTDLVKAECSQEWENNIYPKYFVQDINSIDQLRKPGLLKIEANVTSGSFVALSPKVIIQIY